MAKHLVGLCRREHAVLCGGTRLEVPTQCRLAEYTTRSFGELISVFAKRRILSFEARLNKGAKLSDVDRRVLRILRISAPQSNGNAMTIAKTEKTDEEVSERDEFYDGIDEKMSMLQEDVAHTTQAVCSLPHFDVATLNRTKQAPTNACGTWKCAFVWWKANCATRKES